MSECPITGDATVQRRDDGLHWLQADTAIHVSTELLDNLDDEGREFLTAKYALDEPCPYQPDTIHTRLRKAP